MQGIVALVFLRRKSDRKESLQSGSVVSWDILMELCVTNIKLSLFTLLAA